MGKPTISYTTTTQGTTSIDGYLLIITISRSTAADHFEGPGRWATNHRVFATRRKGCAAGQRATSVRARREVRREPAQADAPARLNDVFHKHPCARFNGYLDLFVAGEWPETSAPSSDDTRKESRIVKASGMATKRMATLKSPVAIPGPPRNI